MGTWGNDPWDNDTAADWYADLFAKTKLAERVENTLRFAAVEGNQEEIRAAAAILIALGRTYVWPVDYLKEHLALAANQLEKVLQLNSVAESPELVEEIKGEIAELRTRLSEISPSGPKRTRRQPWWKFWP